MPERKIQSVDLSKLQVVDVITFALTQSSGRRLSISLGIDDLLGDYAYASVLAAEQLGQGSDTYCIRQDLSLNLARLPLDVTIGESPYALDLTPSWSGLIKPRRTQATMEATQWHPIMIEFDELALTDRTKGAIYPDTAALQQLSTSTPPRTSPEW